MKNKRYVEVILPLPVKGTFTYYWENDDILQVGQRVVVQFGVRKLYSAIIKTIHNNKPSEYDVKKLLAIIDEEPVVNSIQLKFWDWISKYYMSDLGDVMNAALPSSLKLASESVIVIHNEFDGNVSEICSNTQLILDALILHKQLYVNEISKLVSTKNLFSLINDLVRKEILQIKENLHDKFKPKVINIVKFSQTEKILKDLKLTKKQYNFTSNYLDLVKKHKSKDWTISELLNKFDTSRSVFDNLVKKRIFRVENRSISRIEQSIDNYCIETSLVDFQQKAINEIKKSFKVKDVCLLHGVTSSGKTELYIHLISEQIKLGKQVLYLLPEIALSHQIIKRLQRHFGNSVIVSNSHLNNSERVEVWKATQQGNIGKEKHSIILGARSSLFLPFDNLGLVIIDEEHDFSYKQHNPSPRYHARDSAIYLAKLHSAKVLLGSATPSIESYYNVANGKYSLVNMHSRFKGIALPKIEIIDIHKLHLRKKMIRQFSPQMFDVLTKTLDAGKQVILFQNRRGYANIINCKNCSHVISCERCDVCLTYHKWNNQLKCHYCGYIAQIPKSCPFCRSDEFNDKGFGTEQIEESLKELFPQYVVKRMDYDTTRGKKSFYKIISDFENGKINILVGTQMLSKGLDFGNVAMVGILNADSMLHFPDFRSYERAFQLMMQVSGRAGRKGKQGKVLIQTRDIKNPIFNMLKDYNFNGFISQQTKERQEFYYPPYTRIINITLKHKNQIKIDDTASKLAFVLRQSFGKRVLGPEYPMIARVRNLYNKNILLKIEHTNSISHAKKIINKIIFDMSSNYKFKGVRFVLDVDPF